MASDPQKDASAEAGGDESKTTVVQLSGAGDVSDVTATIERLLARVGEEVVEYRLLLGVHGRDASDLTDRVIRADDDELSAADVTIFDQRDADPETNEPPWFVDDL